MDTGILLNSMSPSRLIYQTATMAALLSGVYDGPVKLRELLLHGDFGVGTFNGLDGELLILHGQPYQLRADGNASSAPPDTAIPFATVTRFAPQHTIEVSDPHDRAALVAVIDDCVGSANSMVAVRISGTFSVVKTRTVRKQHQPYQRFTEATRDQHEVDLADIEGTLAGFRMPQWLQGISVAGFHMHFIDVSRRLGGHALDYNLVHGTVEIDVCSDLHLSLPETPEFDSAVLNDSQTDAEIRQTEGN